MVPPSTRRRSVCLGRLRPRYNRGREQGGRPPGGRDVRVDLETVRWDVEDGVGTLTLNRPEAVNAFTARMLSELRKVLDFVERDSGVRVLVVTGAGRGFSAGQDLKEHMASDGADVIGEHLEKYYNPVFERLYRLEKPTVAAVHGAAAGAGMSLALACDLRIAADNARFLQAFVKIGLVPDSGSTYFLPRVVGLARALELALLGDAVDAATALQMGLVNRVVPADRLAEETRALARRLAEGPPVAQALIKRGIRYGATHDFGEALQYEAWLQATAARTEDHKEGVAAFVEKRAPRFTGR
jgi:2-(1,2-epoxy-1,2-dihydrophenyl)acetyl-CoA isomerase